MRAVGEPRVSVITPAYNGTAWLEETIPAVLTQTMPDFEYILVDDGSTDDSRAIAHRFAARDARVRVIEQANQGGAAARNAGLANARAPLAAMLDQDDVCSPERLARQLAYMEQHPEVAVVGTFLALIDGEGRKLNQRYPLPHGVRVVTEGLDTGCMLANPSVMLRRDAVLSVGGYRTLFSMVDDYDLWLRLKDAGYLLDNIPEHLLFYRLHGRNHSTTRNLDLAWERGIAQAAHSVRRSGGADPTLNMSVPFSLALCIAAFDAAGAGYLCRCHLLRAHMEAFRAFGDTEAAESYRLLCDCLRHAPQGDLPPWGILGRLFLRNVRGRNWKECFRLAGALMMSPGGEV